MVKLLNWIQQDLAKFRHASQAGAAPILQPGLYTYRLTPPGGRRRVHLRVEADRCGVMFVDVNDVVHLNQTATEIAKWALDGVAKSTASLWLRQRGDRRAGAQQRRDLQSIYEMVARFSDPDQGCPTCALGGVERQPLFSTAIHAPYKADLAITYACNNDCPHCYNESDRMSLGAMPVDDWKRVIDKLHGVGIPHLIFTGGEATLYADLPELIAHANSRGSICGLNTNARRMSYASYADELASAGLNHVQVTLGSHRAEIHDRMMNARSFEQTVRGIENAQAAGLHTITNTTLMSMNAGEIEQTIEFLYSLGIRTFAVNGMIYSGGGFDTGQSISEERMSPILIRIRDKADEMGMRFLWYTPTEYCRLSPVELEIGAKRCNAGEYSLCVEPNADILPCQSFYVAAGNLLRDPWQAIWNSDLFRSFRDRELDPQAYGLPEKCWECPDLPLCGGGCRIQREAESGQRVAGTAGCSSGKCGSGGCSGVAGSAQSQLDSGQRGFVSIASLATVPAAKQQQRLTKQRETKQRETKQRVTKQRGTGIFRAVYPEG